MRPAGLAFALTLGIAGVLAPLRAARACSCMPPPPPTEAAARAAAVFEGRTFGARREQNSLRFSFEVTRVWKGEVPPSIDIVTPMQSASCGRSYEFGVPYIVYASAQDDGSFGDNLCSRTRLVVDAVEDLDVLGAGHAPLQDGTASPGPSGPDVEPPRIEPAPLPATSAKAGKGGCDVSGGAWDPPHALVVVLVLLFARRRARMWHTIRA